MACDRIAPAVRGGASLHTMLLPFEHRFPEIVMPILDIYRRGPRSMRITRAMRRAALQTRQGKSLSECLTET